MDQIDFGGRLTWLGHAAFLVETPNGRTLLIDPWIENNPACPAELKRIEHCDVILVTHGHNDHLADAAPIAVRTGATVIAIVEVAEWLASKGVADAVGMNKGGTVRVKGIEVTMVHAYHSSSIRDGETSIYGGEAAGFVVKLENGFTLYHAGDTNVFGDMRLIGELYAPQLALLPIGGHYTMSPHEAAMAARLLGAPHVVPMHHGTFPVLTGDPDRLADLLADRPDIRLHPLRPGDSLT